MVAVTGRGRPTGPAQAVALVVAVAGQSALDDSEAAFRRERDAVEGWKTGKPYQETDAAGTQPAPICPECRAGKCGNCNGEALDVTTDEIVDCACATHGHPAPGRDL